VTHPREPLVDALTAELGADAVRTEPDDLAEYGRDRCRGPWSVAASVIALPRTVAQVQAVVRHCAAAGTPIVPSGGRTGLAGGATASRGEVVLSLERMHAILEVDPAARILRCEAGATVGAVQDAAHAHGLLYPVDFAAKGSAQIGGSIATNAGGVKVLRYGTTRSWVSGLRVVVASGDVLDIGGALVKDNTGYDLRQLFIGAEGTLGIVVEATMRLTSPPLGSVVALAAVPNDAAILRLLDRLQRGAVLQAFECLEHGCLAHVLAHRGRAAQGPFQRPSALYVLVEVETATAGEAGLALAHDELVDRLGAAQEAGDIDDAIVAATAQQARDLWALREDISESLHRHRPHKNDVALPVATVPEFLQRWRELVARAVPEAEALAFGHVGDGNLHLNLLPPADADATAFTQRCIAYDEDVYALVEALHGSISAEHGIGLLKRAHLHHSRGPGELAMMRAIKQALDPQGLFNPGKVLP
jgi:FAD/FMN-containing dehydrogenase